MVRPFVQFAKNTTYHERIRQSPYEAMFGVKGIRGITSYFLPILKPKNNSKKFPILVKRKNRIKKLLILLKIELSGGHSENHISRKNFEEDLHSTTFPHQALTGKLELILIKRAAAVRIQVAEMC